MNNIVRILNNADIANACEYLYDHVEASMFLISNIQRAGLEFKEKDFHANYFGAFDDTGRIVGILAHYWNGNILMQAAEEIRLINLTAVFRDHLTRPISGIIGPNQQTEIVLDQLGIADRDLSINRTEGLFRLDLDTLLFPPKPENSTLEIANAGSISRNILFSWIKAYEIEAMGSEENEILNRRVDSRVNKIVKSGDYWVLQIDDQQVSFSGFNARLSDIVQVGPVWTPPEFRNNGFARLLIAMVLENAKAQDVKRAVLFTNDPAATNAYQALGFKRIGSYRLALSKCPILIT